MMSEITLFVVVDSAISPLRRRIDGLVRGSAVKIVSFGIRVPPTLKNIARMKPQVCIIEAAGSEAVLLAFVRDALAESPATRIVLMGEKFDSAALARAAVSGVWNHLPVVINHKEFNAAISDAAAGRRPGQGSPFGQALELLPPRPKPSTRRRVHLVKADRDDIDRCRVLGLDDEAIAAFLGLDDELVRRHGAANSNSGGMKPWRLDREGAVVAAVVGLAVIAWVFSQVWLDSR